MLLKYRYLLLIVFAVLASSACQRVISVDIGDTTPKLVIEGNVTNVNGLQTVTLSQSIPYSNTNVFPAVSGAIVTVNDQSGANYKFTEVKPGTYTINNFKAKTLSLYLMTVQVGTQTYYAGSVMPVPVNLDSLTLQVESFGNKTQKTVVVNYQDPPGVANQYRFIMYVNSVQVKRVFVANDQLSNGRSTSTILFQQDVDLKTGDKVDIDMQCVDPFIYNYWNSLSNQGGNTPQDSSTPANPPSNFGTSVLGYFSAHTQQRKSIVIP